MLGSRLFNLAVDELLQPFRRQVQMVGVSRQGHREFRSGQGFFTTCVRCCWPCSAISPTGAGLVP